MIHESRINSWWRGEGNECIKAIQNILDVGKLFVVSEGWSNKVHQNKHLYHLDFNLILFDKLNFSPSVYLKILYSLNILIECKWVASGKVRCNKIYTYKILTKEEKEEIQGIEKQPPKTQYFRRFLWSAS